MAEALGRDPPERVARLVEELGLPNSLHEAGVPEGDLDGIADEFGERAGDIRKILRVAY